jgi:hypothetical protein
MKAQPYETADAIAGLPSLRTNKLLPSGTSTSHFPNLPMRSNTAALLFERARLEVQTIILPFAISSHRNENSHPVSEPDSIDHDTKPISGSSLSCG